MRLLVSMLLGTVLLLATAGTAGAQSGVDAAIDALKSDPVYVDPDAELASQVDADALRTQIKSAAPRRCTSPCCPRTRPAAAPGGR